MSIWTDTSLGRLQGVDPRLVGMMEHLRGLGHNFQISEGLREQARQQELFNAGKSKTLNSKHLTGNAVDIFLVDPATGQPNWDAAAYAPIGAAAKKYAQEQGLPFTWGGDWGWDSVHFQLNDGSGGGGQGVQKVDDIINELDRGSAGGQQARVSTQGSLPFFADPQPQFSGRDRTRLAMASIADMLLSADPRRPRSNIAGGIRERLEGNQQRNQTAEWLANQGRGDLADAVLSGALTGEQAAQIVYRETEADKGTAMMQNYAFWLAQGKTPEEAQALATSGGTTIRIGGDSEVGTIPAGYALVEDENDPSGYRFEPITGGPADTTAEQELRANQRLGTAYNALGRVNQIFETMESAELPTTGFFGDWLSQTGGTAAHDIRQSVQTLEGMIAFKTLREIKESGATLGAISQEELNLLRANIASLKQSQSRTQFVENLNEVKRTFEDIIKRTREQAAGSTERDTGVVEWVIRDGQLVRADE